MNNATRWWWIRHAPSAGEMGVIHGQDEVDADLSDTEAIADQKSRLPKDAVWLTSGLARAVQTAGALGAPDNCRAVSKLMEQSYGDWNGMRWADIKGEEVKEFWQNFATNSPPNGESFVQMVERVSEAIASLNHEYHDRDIIAVTHAGTIRAALTMALNMFAQSALSLQIDNISLTRIDAVHDNTGPAWRVATINMTARSGSLPIIFKPTK